MRVAQRAHRLQEARCGRHHPALALHRFEHDCGHVATGHRRFQLGDVVEIDVTETARQRLVAFLVFRLRGRGDRCQRAAVETATEGDDDATLRRAALRGRPFADQLDRGLVRFRAGIAQKRALGETRGRHQFFGQAHRWLAVEHVAGVPELAGLFDQRRGQFGMAMAQAAHGDAAGQVDVLAPLGVPQSAAAAALQDHLAGAVDRQVIVAAEGEQVRGIGCRFGHVVNSIRNSSQRN